MNLPILKGDVARQRAEIVQARCDWIRLPVDDQSPSLTSESRHWQMDDVAWWRYLVRQQGDLILTNPCSCNETQVGVWTWVFGHGCVKQQQCAAHLGHVELQDPSRVVALLDGDLGDFHARSLQAGLACSN